MSSAREAQPGDLGGYVNNLGGTFLETFDVKSQRNPARYFSTKCNELCDVFLDSLSRIGGSDQNLSDHTFKLSQLGDEIQPEPKETDQSGTKRPGSPLDGPDHKKRKLDDSEQKQDGMPSDDDDISMESDDDDAPKKKGKRKRTKLPDKFKDDDDFKALIHPGDTPSRAGEFFDPINHCKINLDRESRMNDRFKERMTKFEMIGADDVDIEGEQIKHINRERVDRYLKETALGDGKTVQQDIATMVCLGLQDHLRNMFEEMDQWRRMRMDVYGQRQRQRGLVPMKRSSVDAQEWMDALNGKYAEKQQIVEAQDEVAALEEEQTDLKLRKMTSILSAEEEKRLNQLPSKIAAAKHKEKESMERKDQINVSAMKALGGDFSFGNNKKKVKELRADKYYVIDVVNMLAAHQKMNQQHLKQLSRLHLKQTS